MPDSLAEKRAVNGKSLPVRGDLQTGFHESRLQKHGLLARPTPGLKVAHILTVIGVDGSHRVGGLALDNIDRFHRTRSAHHICGAHFVASLRPHIYTEMTHSVSGEDLQLGQDTFVLVAMRETIFYQTAINSYSFKLIML